MSRELLAEELDRNITARMRGAKATDLNDPLLQLAAELCLLPNQEFRDSLRDQLLEQADTRRPDTYATSSLLPSFETGPIPSLSSSQLGLLPADPRSLFFSFL